MRDIRNERYDQYEGAPQRQQAPSPWYMDEGNEGGELKRSNPPAEQRSLRQGTSLYSGSNVYTTGRLTGYLDSVERTSALRSSAVDATSPLTEQELVELQELYSVLPFKLAQALERAGYRSVQQVAQTRDTELLYIRNIGTERLQSIREVVPYQAPPGSEHEQHGPDDLLQRVRRLESKISRLEAIIRHLIAER